MSLESIKFLLIGTAVAFAGGLLRVLISIQNKEQKRLWEHLVTLLIVIIVGFTISYVLHKAKLDNEWYSIATLFMLGYGYDRFLKMITTNFPNWIDLIVKGFLEKRYGIDMDKKNNNAEYEND